MKSNPVRQSGKVTRRAMLAAPVAMLPVVALTQRKTDSDPLREQAQLACRSFLSAARRVRDLRRQRDAMLARFGFTSADDAEGARVAVALDLAEIKKSNAREDAIAAILAVDGQADSFDITDTYGCMAGNPAEFIDRGIAFRVEGAPLRLTVRRAGLSA